MGSKVGLGRGKETHTDEEKLKQNAKSTSEGGKEYNNEGIGQGKKGKKEVCRVA